VRTQHGTRLVNSDEDEKFETSLLWRVGHARIFCESVISTRSTGFVRPDTLCVYPCQVKGVRELSL